MGLNALKMFPLMTSPTCRYRAQPHPSSALTGDVPPTPADLVIVHTSIRDLPDVFGLDERGDSGWFSPRRTPSKLRHGMRRIDGDLAVGSKIRSFANPSNLYFIGGRKAVLSTTRCSVKSRTRSRSTRENGDELPIESRPRGQGLDLGPVPPGRPGSSRPSSTPWPDSASCSSLLSMPERQIGSALMILANRFSPSEGPEHCLTPSRATVPTGGKR